jgi:hypothetical protein
MSSGLRCSCKPPDRRFWRVTQYMSNKSAFSGYRQTPSRYSEIRCLQCGNFWRTKADYVCEIAHAEGDDGFRIVENGWRNLDGTLIVPTPPTPLTREEQLRKQWKQRMTP